MYLKSLELTGFKSFANKTKLEFGHGLTSIVGPNGCGKSNVSDALRWVLGEQSAKALRGTKMQDCIFNGTDNRKPLGMAEVSITFADCETLLKTEYNEVTISRRVFRSGEGQYFINKTPCRLKDIQRLFMDTGIGTTSYSLMEQGRIDYVLSSRPEDRRAIFEEASGITKFKSDKKEAIRKLEYTEANLLRLADVIREVKRQIGSLQRQAGKARRYKILKDELRDLDIFITREHLTTADNNIHDIESKISSLSDDLNIANTDVNDLESGVSSLRKSLIQTEREIGESLESGVQAESKLTHTRELIRMYYQRIEEYSNWSERDSREISDIKQQVLDKNDILNKLSDEIKNLEIQHNGAKEELDLCNDQFEKHLQRIDSVRTHIQKLHEESLGFESMSSKLQNQLIEIESKERFSVIQKERLAAEKAQLIKISDNYEKRLLEITSVLKNMQFEVDNSEKNLREIEEKKAGISTSIKTFQQEYSDLVSQLAEKKAQVEFLSDIDEVNEDFPAGARLLLDKSNPLSIDKDKFMGALVSHIDVESGFRIALEASLRSWLDAVLVDGSDNALTILMKLESQGKGSARLITIDSSYNNQSSELTDACGEKLINHIKCKANIMSLLQNLIGNVFVVESLDSISLPISSKIIYVTHRGALIKGNGCMEFWQDIQGSNPMSRKHLYTTAETAFRDIRKRAETHKILINKLQTEEKELEEAIYNSRSILDQKTRAMAQKEGESQIVSGEAKESRERLETVTWELESLNDQNESGEPGKTTIINQINKIKEQKQNITSEIGETNSTLREMETQHSELQSKVTNSRISFAELAHKRSNAESRRIALETRITELESLAEDRSTGVLSFKTDMEKHKNMIKDAELSLLSLEETVSLNNSKVENLRKNREKQSQESSEMENSLSRKRASLEDIRNSKSNLEIRFTENKLRRQNHIDRIVSEYNISVEQIMSASEPEWKGSKPAIEETETRLEELKTKLEAMGPVNLVAIEEYKELEERYAFLTTQEEDLVKSKQQLVDMIRKINRTTSQMFKTTFDSVNDNFQNVFKKLFNGGSAKLVLVNEEDVLECGIEIIARPPGKRLQNISLLSGGERTLTAVALLFSIYLIKPSPFCLLDELDAALDESNISRFVEILKEFLSISQFVVITHNRKTMAAANIIYGVTMQEKGVSKIVSMKFINDKKDPVSVEKTNSSTV